jgi:hypothetical protein
MTLEQLVNYACDKTKFREIAEYFDFCRKFLEFAATSLQAIIVSRNERHYRFFQYKEDGNYNVTRPINSNIMIRLENLDAVFDTFNQAILHIRDIKEPKERECINHVVYTCQQAIGATLDALPAGKSNTARKRNGDLFEHFIRLIIKKIGITVTNETIQMPIIVNGIKVHSMSYEHDLIIHKNNQVVAIGSVKTSSKDRLDKFFLDKFLRNKLAHAETPHFAIFLNDVQRKGHEGNYGINGTFLPGHFKGYTILLNPLDGVYYCDIRSEMETDEMLQKHIRTLDHLFIEDIWQF